eukprot:114387-Prorocentrum_minimum.AAC.1
MAPPTNQAEWGRVASREHEKTINPPKKFTIISSHGHLAGELEVAGGVRGPEPGVEGAPLLRVHRRRRLRGLQVDAPYGPV